MAVGLTGCDPDDVEYFGSTDPFFFVFSFGDTVSMKPKDVHGTVIVSASGQVPSTNAVPTEASVSNSTTGAVERVLYSSDRPSYPISFDAAPRERNQDSNLTVQSPTAPAASAPLPSEP